MIFPKRGFSIVLLSLDLQIGPLTSPFVSASQTPLLLINCHEFSEFHHHPD